MTNEEAIKALRLEGGLEISGNARRLAQFMAALSVAIDALSTNHVVDITNMKPLTLEQLREMVDKPAYLYIYDTAMDSGWHIIKAVTDDKIIFRGWNTVYVPVSSMGKCFDLYAHSPAHIDWETWEPCEWCCDEVIFDSEDMKLEMQHPLKDSSEIVKPNYCPMCGRPLTSEAWAELEKRIGGAV